jgi:hypothetical protein
MASSEKSSHPKGVGCCTLIFIIFLILKLCKAGTVADWPWVYVFLPLIIEVGVVCFALCCVLACFMKKANENETVTAKADLTIQV